MTAQSIATVEAFVVRARTVAGHSLCADLEGLRRLIAGFGDLSFDPETGTATMTRRWPPEEQLESLASRVRPLLLQDDPVHWGKVLKALKFLLQGVENNDAALAWLEEAKRHWTRVSDRSGA